MRRSYWRRCLGCERYFAETIATDTRFCTPLCKNPRRDYSGKEEKSLLKEARGRPVLFKSALGRGERRRLSKKKLAPKRSLSFYDSPEWKSLRYHVFKTYGRRCMCCGASNQAVHVDHIKPRSLYPMLALAFSNLQVLCESCNLGKSNTDETDFRAP